MPSLISQFKQKGLMKS